MTSNRVGIPSEFIQQLRERVDIVPLVGGYVPLVHKGRNYWACCPFHHEKTPSFCVYAEDQSFHCYGCGVTGDIYTFLMKIESLDFIEAVELLAKKNGIPLPEYKNDYDIVKTKRKKDRFLSLLKDANERYKSNLKSSKIALDYLSKRELTENEINEFEIGYSNGHNDIVNYLKGKGYTFEEMLEVGIIKKNDYGSYYDFFADRLMFPLFNKFGDCVGFSGRDLQGNSPAKYKNSSQSLVFDKSSTIFAFNKVKKLSQTQKIDYVILCEGQIDVISMHKAGFKTAMACLGTALTEIHAREISRITENVVLCLDGDSAGINATLKALPILRQHQLNVRVASIEGGKDPDEVIKNFGKEKMAEIINKAVDSIEFELTQLSTHYNLENSLDRTRFIDGAFKILSVFDNLSQKEVYIPIIASLSKISPTVIRSDLSKSTTQSSSVESNTQDVSEYSYDALIKSQQFILASLIHNKDYVVITQDTDLFLKDSTLIKLFNYIKEKKLNNEPINLTSIFDMFNEDEINDSISPIITFDIDSFKDNAEKHYMMCLQKIKLAKIESELLDLNEKLKNEKDSNLKFELTKQVQELIQVRKQIKEKNNINKSGGF